MKILFAPMEGFTNYIYRQVHARYFPGVACYFMPFFSPNQNLIMTGRDKKEAAPENNCFPDQTAIPAVPQIMAKDPGQFCWAAMEYKKMGYGEVNLNLGCPSSTVCTKGKGAGLLRNPKMLEDLLQSVFSGQQAELPEISVKTRLGWEDPKEFQKIAEVLNRYPLKRVILHPRVRQDFYKEPVQRDAFFEALSQLKHPVVYNGDLNSAEDVYKLKQEYEKRGFYGPEEIMIGRGLLRDPSLARQMQGGNPLTKEEYLSFMEDLLEAYRKGYASDHNALCRMKEQWVYAGEFFPGNDKALKGIRKAKTVEAYRAAVRGLR